MNTGSWLVLGLVLLAFAAVVWTLIRKKRRGESTGCCGPCSGCPMSGNCGKKPNP